MTLAGFIGDTKKNRLPIAVFVVIFTAMVLAVGSFKQSLYSSLEKNTSLWLMELSTVYCKALRVGTGDAADLSMAQQVMAEHRFLVQGQDTLLAVTDRAGAILLASRDQPLDGCTNMLDYLGQVKLLRGYTPEIIGENMQVSASDHVIYTVDRDPFFLVYAPAPGGQQYFFTVVPYGVIQQEIQAITGNVYAMALLLLAVFLLVMIYVFYANKRQLGVLAEQQKQEAQSLLEKANRDPLTKLLNKVATRKTIDSLLREGSEQVHAFLILDIDFFKNVNDHYGHATGDLVLTLTAAGLRGIFRSSDILGRIGGDELVVFCRDIRDEEQAIRHARQVCQLFRTMGQQVADRPITLSCSIGIAMAPQGGSSFNELYVNADLALYNAKEQGRDCYSVYRPHMRKEPKSVG